MKKVIYENELDEYMYSDKYSKDCAKVASRFPRNVWGGFTKNGYTRYETITGEIVTISTKR